MFCSSEGRGSYRSGVGGIIGGRAAAAVVVVFVVVAAVAGAVHVWHIVWSRRSDDGNTFLVRLVMAAVGRQRCWLLVSFLHIVMRRG